MTDHTTHDEDATMTDFTAENASTAQQPAAAEPAESNQPAAEPTEPATGQPDQSAPAADSDKADQPAAEPTEPDQSDQSADEATPTPADSVHFSIVFDDEEDDDLAEAPGDAATAAADAADADATGTAAEAAGATAAPSAASVVDLGDLAADAVAAAPLPGDGGAAAPADRSAEATVENARRVNETLGLATSQHTDPLAGATQPEAGEPGETSETGAATTATGAATTLASRIDHRLKALHEDDIPIKVYPTYAFSKVTVTTRRSGRNVIDGMDMACYAGHTYAVLVEEGDEERHAAVASTLAGFTHPDSGAVMNRSANIAELEPVELRGHRIGLIPRRHALRGDLDAETNVLMAMDASNRTFLKPKPVIARELLARTGVEGATAGTKVRDLTPLDRCRVAIARAISCEAEVIIADEPLAGLDDAGREEILVLLTTLARTGDPKRCVIIVTEDAELADAADHTFRM